MSSTDDDDQNVTDAIGAAEHAGETMYDKFRQWMITGGALIVPLVVTLLVIAFVLNFISNTLQPIVDAVRFLGIGPQLQDLVLEALAILVLLLFVFLLGFLADVTERNFAKVFHTVMEMIPGVGGLYRSFRRMSDVFVESNTESFQEVKLVEFPNEGSYSIAFLTAETPDAIQNAAGQMKMQTLFMPLAPNPVMGGFLIHLPSDRIHDMDMGVDEAIEAVVTSGVSVDVEGGGHAQTRSLSMDELGDLGEAGPIDDGFDAHGDGEAPEDRQS